MTLINLRQASIMLGKDQNHLAMLRWKGRWPAHVQVVVKGGKAGTFINVSDLDAFKDTAYAKVIYAEPHIRVIADKLQQAGYLSAAAWLRKGL